MLSPVILPLTLRLLCGSVVELDTLGMIRDLFVMIVSPRGCWPWCSAACWARSICAKAKQRLSSLFQAGPAGHHLRQRHPLRSLPPRV